MLDKPPDTPIKPHKLPDDAYEQFRHELVLPDSVAKPLARFLDLIIFAIARGLTRSPLNGFIILKGPSGSGKTLTTKAFAQALATGYQQASGNVSILFQVHMASLLSELLGRTVQAVGQLFDAVAFSAERRLTIVHIDELESIGFSRERVSASDPSDVIRMVDELLRQLDILSGNPRFLLIGTTNTVGMLDNALIDRADLVIQFEPPDYQACLTILQRAADRVRELDIEVDHGDLKKAAKALTENGQRPSGRLLSKLPLLAFIEGGSRHPTASTIIEVAKRKMAEGFLWL